MIMRHESGSNEELKFVVPVTRNYVYEFVSKMNDAVASEQERGREIKLKDIAEAALTDMLGISAASVLAELFGDDLNEPLAFAERIVSIFGYGSRLILERLMDYADKEIVERVRSSVKLAQNEEG